MIRLFAPPTPDAVIRRNAMTAGSLILHVIVLGLLFVPVSRAVRQGLLEQLAVYLVPPDTPGGEEHSLGDAPVAAVAAQSGSDTEGGPPASEDPTGEPSAARGKVPLLSMANLDPARLLRAEDHAFTELQVDSTVLRDPSSAAPDYPRLMLRKGIEGAAAVLYVVDSTGLVDTTTYRVVSTTHEDFALEVRRVLPGMRFRPAFQEGRAVRQLVQQTFRFRITRTDTVRAPSAPPPAA